VDELGAVLLRNLAFRVGFDLVDEGLGLRCVQGFGRYSDSVREGRTFGDVFVVEVRKGVVVVVVDVDRRWLGSVTVGGRSVGWRAVERCGRVVYLRERGRWFGRCFCSSSVVV